MRHLLNDEGICRTASEQTGALVFRFQLVRATLQPAL
jgi:hypothetical protein